MKQDFKKSNAILNLAVATSFGSLFLISTAFARHEDQAGVYKAEAYRERVTNAVASLIQSSTYVSTVPSAQINQVNQIKQIDLVKQAQPNNADKLVSQVKNFFFGAEKPEAIHSQPVAQKEQPFQLKRLPSSTVLAPVALPVQKPNHDVTRNLPVNKWGVETYQLSTSQIPYLEITKEAKVDSQTYQLSTESEQKFKDYAIAPRNSPDVITAKAFQDMNRVQNALPNAQFAKMNTAKYTPVTHEDLDKVKWMATVDVPIKILKFTPLSADEIRLLNGILLYRQGDKCAVAVSLFYPLTKTAFYESEGNYFLAMCSKQLGLMTDFYEKSRRVFEAEDIHYSQKLFKVLSEDVPPEVIDGLGKSLFKLSANKKAFEGVEPLVKGNVYFILANFGAKTERFKTTLSYSQLVPEKHPKFLEAQFLRALAEYETGDKTKAMEIQEKLISQLSLDKKNDEFQALVALNLARMQFQEKKFKEAREDFLKVSKDHPMWVQSLTEMGWSQLQMSDFGGAIGNMYSLQSPFFNAVYKPESYVIRTIGYLNLCQYGDAYKTLSILEKQYRPILDKMVAYQSGAGHATYQTIKAYISSKVAVAEVDGLPAPVIREMARHKDFLVRQLALNRQAEEKDIYTRLDRDVENSLAKTQASVTKSRSKIELLKKNIILAANNGLQVEAKKQMQSDLEHEFRLLNSQFFQIDLFNDAKKAVSAYRAESVKLAEQRIAVSKAELESTLQKRLTAMKEDLIRILENNELLRYEVYSGSGENIRFQVAGGEKSNRVPASVLPKSKSLQWDFDGEYWEDEIGHYRSSLKNNCPDNKQARNGGNQ